MIINSERSTWQHGRDGHEDQGRDGNHGTDGKHGQDGYYGRDGHHGREGHRGRHAYLIFVKNPTNIFV